MQYLSDIRKQSLIHINASLIGGGGVTVHETATPIFSPKKLFLDETLVGLCSLHYSNTLTTEVAMAHPLYHTARAPDTAP